jgi:hypothetical protein
MVSCDGDQRSEAMRAPNVQLTPRGTRRPIAMNRYDVRNAGNRIVSICIQYLRHARCENSGGIFEYTAYAIPFCFPRGLRAAGGDRRVYRSPSITGRNAGLTK